MNSTLQDLEQERKNRGINKKDMSILVGYQHTTGWMQAVREGHNPSDKIEMAKFVFAYHDENGYIPTPSEVKRNV